MSWMPGRTSDGWFRVQGRDVTTTMLVIAVDVVAMIVCLFLPGLRGLLALDPGSVFAGQVWRLFTWPLAEGFTVFALLNLFFFWYFGSELEGQIGRVGMARLLAGLWAAFTVAAVLAGLVAPMFVSLAGIGELELAVLLLWIAEYPRRPLFFGIQAWVVGLVLLALNLLPLLASGLWGNVLALILALFAGAVLARRMGMLTDATWLPGRRTRPVKVRPTREQKQQAKTEAKRADDRERLDTLLDKINEHGLDALTPAERQELSAIRDRLRSQR